MTLRLVPNVTELPIGNVQDIPEMLRLLADDLDAEVWGSVETLVALMVTPEGIASVTYGENGSRYELIGILEEAKLRVIAAEDD